MISIVVQKFEDLGEGFLAHFQSWVELFDILIQEHFGLSLVHIFILLHSHLCPNFLNKFFNNVIWITWHLISLLFKNCFDLIETSLCSCIAFIAIFEITLRIFILHFIEVVIISEKSMWWLETWETSNETSCCSSET